MARTYHRVNYELLHATKFSTVIRGHHVYNTIWSAVVGEILMVKPDTLNEALQYDRFSMGVFKISENSEEMLVGHAPMEISSLLSHFFNKDADNFIRARVIGKRMREVGLVVPATYEAYSKNQKDAIIFDQEIAKRREKCSTLNLKHKPKTIFRAFPIFDIHIE